METRVYNYAGPITGVPKKAQQRIASIKKCRMFWFHGIQKKSSSKKKRIITRSSNLAE